MNNNIMENSALWPLCESSHNGQIHCHWENGSSLALIPGVDHFHQDMTQEPVIESSEEQEPDLEL